MPLKCRRNHIRDNLYLLEKVEDFSIAEEFDCGNEEKDKDLNEFFRDDAVDYKKALLAETYALYLAWDDKQLGPLAFVSLANDTIKLTRSRKEKLFHHRKRYIDDFPAVKIARLGVHKAFQNKNVGTKILNLLKNFFTTDNRTGCRFLTVDAYNESRVLKFYKKNEFEFLRPNEGGKTPPKTRIMYYDLARFAVSRSTRKTAQR